MTKRERAQVVELLRCAADNTQSDDLPGFAPFTDASMAFAGYGGLAWAAVLAVCDPLSREHDDLDTFLEAAARVEEGNWP